MVVVAVGLRCVGYGCFDGCMGGQSGGEEDGEAKERKKGSVGTISVATKST